MKLSHKANQHGFTLIELMIGMLIGLISVAATISAFTSIVRSNSDYLKMVRLNQELNAVMTLMVRDLKRAGYSASATGKTVDNIFMTAATTNLNFVTSREIQLSYDMNGDGGFDDGEEVAYKFDTTAGSESVAMRYRNADMSWDSWERISDEKTVQITNLTFTDDVLYTASVEIRYIGISLTGELINDAGVSRNLTERVRVRNDRPPV